MASDAIGVAITSIGQPCVAWLPRLLFGWAKRRRAAVLRGCRRVRAHTRLQRRTRRRVCQRVRERKGLSYSRRWRMIITSNLIVVVVAADIIVVVVVVVD